MDYDEEVVCVGDLHKKNTTGLKSWNLRRFALIGVYMVYYKQGIKRGEWDITGCNIRNMTPEEAGEPSAKFAFCLEGIKKLYIFNASSDKNRNKWIEMLTAQIIEYKNMSRRFVRRGEVILGTGTLKRRNLFGKVPISLIVTNFPRVIVIDSSTLIVKDQVNWLRGHSIFNKIDKTKFQLSFGAKDLNFEDPENGLLYWENVFRLVETCDLYVAKKYKVVKIGLPGGEDELTTETNIDPKDLKAAQNLLFLEEGSANINQLLVTINSKIESIDTSLTQAISDGWIISENLTLTYHERLIKRTQFQMLKENVEMISENLEKLTNQIKKSPLTISFDRVAIQNVIDEAGTLMALLNADDDEEDEDIEDENQQLQFGDDVQNVDYVVSQMEEDNIATEEIIAQVEFLSLFVDESIQKMNEIFDSLIIPEDLVFTSQNFDPNIINVRPHYWKDVRSKRLLIKEFVDKLEGVLEDTIVENRKSAVARVRLRDASATEEVQMIQEVVANGRLLNMEAVMQKGGIEMAAMTCTLDNFDPNSPDLRPPAWRPIRLRRAIAREDITKHGDDAEYIRERPNRVAQEERIMLDEIAKHGNVISYGSPEENPQRVIDALSNGNNERVSLIRERAATLRDRAYTMKDKETIGGGRTRLPSAAPVYRGRASSFLPPVTNLDVSEDSFDPYNENIRPTGWDTVRMKRIQEKEAMERLEGVEEETIILNRKKKIAQEEALMVNEVMRHGNVMGMSDCKIKIVGLTPLVVSGSEGWPSGPSMSKDQEWRETLMARVLRQEQQDREAGVDEDSILRKRVARESEEEKLMREEEASDGVVFGKREFGRKRAATLAQDAANIEFSEETFDPYNPSKRPPQWTEVRQKRVMLRDHMDRISGFSETRIAEGRALREVDEEMVMVGEVLCYGRLLGVGETASQTSANLDINKSTFCATNATLRPPGWAVARLQRVQYKELEERLNGGSEVEIAAKRDARVEEEDADMVREAEGTGVVTSLGSRVIAKSASKATLKPAESELTKSVEITSKDLHPTDPSKKPMGWADIKLRKVYLKEWQDRKDGVDEDEIISRRFKRELEAEEEMAQAMTVHGRIQLIENRIQSRAAKPVFPKGFSGASNSGVSAARFKKAASQAQAQQAASRLSAAAMSLEISGQRLEAIAESNESG